MFIDPVQSVPKTVGMSKSVSEALRCLSVSSVHPESAFPPARTFLEGAYSGLPITWPINLSCTAF